MVNYLLASITNTHGELRTAEERKEAARQETLAMALLRGADRTRFGSYVVGSPCQSVRCGSR